MISKSSTSTAYDLHGTGAETSVGPPLDSAGMSGLGVPQIHCPEAHFGMLRGCLCHQKRILYGRVARHLVWSSVQFVANIQGWGQMMRTRRTEATSSVWDALSVEKEESDFQNGKLLLEIRYRKIMRAKDRVCETCYSTRIGSGRTDDGTEVH